MKQMLLIVLVSFVGFASTQAQTSKSVPPPANQDERDKQELIRLTKEISRASVEYDAATLERLMDDNFVSFFGNGGKHKGKAERIKRWSTKSPDSTGEGASTPSDFQVFLYGDTAIVVSRITDIEPDKEGVKTIRTFAFDVWKRTKSGWR